MKSPRYTYLIVLAALALIGSTAVQLMWIAKGYEQAKSHVEDQLESALANAIEEIATAEEIAFIARVGTQDGHGDSLEVHEYHFVQSNEVSWSDSSDLTTISTTSSSETHPRLQRRIEVNNDRGSVHVEVRDENGVVLTSDSSASEEDIMVTAVMAMEEKGRLEDVVRRIQMENFKQKGDWKSRLDSAKLSQHLTEEFKETGIQEAFDFAVVNGEGVPFNGFKTATYASSFHGLQARRALFPADLKTKNVFLDVQMQPSFSTLFKEVWVMAILSLLFTLTMLLLFVLIWKKLMSQSRLSQMKSDFINNMSHELKTPLATISLAADAIVHPRTKNDQDAITGFVSTIKKEHVRMHRHIDRVLQMAQLESQSFELQKERIDVSSMLQEVVAEFKTRSDQENKPIGLTAPDSPVSANVDALHLRSAIENLIDNAFNYNPEGTHVKITLTTDQHWLVITVEDDGVGISEKDQALVFERFYRVQSGNIHTVKGFGLGLNYVDTVIKAHEGSLKLESQSGDGTRFALKLPLT